MTTHPRDDLNQLDQVLELAHREATRYLGDLDDSPVRTS
jgi:hypothetical protein